MANSITAQLPQFAQSQQAQAVTSVPDSNFEAIKANHAQDPGAQTLSNDVKDTDADADGGGNGGAGGGQGKGLVQARSTAPQTTGLANNAPRVENSNAFFAAHPGTAQWSKALGHAAFKTTRPLLPVTSRYFTSNGIANKVPVGYRPLEALRTFNSHAKTPQFKSVEEDFFAKARAAGPQLNLMAIMTGSTNTGKPSDAAISEMGTPQGMASLLNSAKVMQNGGQVLNIPTFGQTGTQVRTYPTYLLSLPAQANPQSRSSAASQQSILSRLTASALPTFVRSSGSGGGFSVPSLGGLLSRLQTRSPAMA